MIGNSIDSIGFVHRFCFRIKPVFNGFNIAGTIKRVKGIVNAAETPKRRAIVQAVGRRSDVELDESWGDLLSPLKRVRLLTTACCRRLRTPQPATFYPRGATSAAAM